MAVERRGEVAQVLGLGGRQRREVQQLQAREADVQQLENLRRVVRRGEAREVRGGDGGGGVEVAAAEERGQRRVGAGCVRT